MLKAFKEREKKLAKENENIRSSSHQQTIIDEEVSSVKNGDPMRWDVQFELVKLKMEVEAFKKKNIKLKIKANDEKKAKQRYKMLLLSCFLFHLCLSRHF